MQCNGVLNYDIFLFLLGLLIISGVILISCLKKVNVDFFDLGFLFLSVYAFAYLLKPAFIKLSPCDFITFQEYYPFNNNGYFLLAYLLAISGSIFFALGYYAGAYRILPLPSLSLIKNTKQLLLASNIGLLAGLVSLLFLLLKVVNGGVGSVLLFHPETRIAFMKSFQGNGHLFFFISVMPLALFTRLLFIWGSKSNIPTSFQKIQTYFWVLCTLVVMATIGGRIQFLGAIIGVISVYHLLVKPINFKSQIIFLSLLALTASVLGVFLQTDFYVQDDQTSFFSPYRLMVRLYGSYDAFDNTVITISRLKNYYFGSTILEDIFVTYLPRVIFPWKPEIFGVVRIQNDIMPELFAYAGLSATYPVGIIGEAYANFGIFGVVIIPFFFGMFFKAVQVKAYNKDMYIVMYAACISLMPMVVRGFGSILSGLFISLCWIYLLCLISRIRIA